MAEVLQLYMILKLKSLSKRLLQKVRPKKFMIIHLKQKHDLQKLLKIKDLKQKKKQQNLNMTGPEMLLQKT